MKELTITTAKTKTRSDVHLDAQIFESPAGEHILSLLRVDGREKECQHFAEEWKHTVERTLVHGEEPPFERMEGALKELNGLLKAVHISEHIKEAHAILGLAGADNILHVAQAGRAEGYLTRSGSTVHITERTTGGGNDAQFLFVASGDLRRGDVVIFSTERLLRTMTAAQITQGARHVEVLQENIRNALETEKETAIFTIIAMKSAHEDNEFESARVSKEEEGVRTSGKSRRGEQSKDLRRLLPAMPSFSFRWPFRSKEIQAITHNIRQWLLKGIRSFQNDLQHPTRKRRAHLLLLASTLIIFIGIWLGFQVTTMSRQSHSRTELTILVEKIGEDIRTAENRRLMGDLESANAILNRAEEEATSVMQHESGLFRTEVLDLLDQIRQKRESISNIVRLTPTLVANLTARNPDIAARGLIGIERGRMIVFDRQNLYSVIVNAVDEPQRLDGDNLILDGVSFPRYNTIIFLTKENRLIELIDGQPTAMKTDDPAGWLSGPDIETYIRFLYILSPQNNQILKYERLSNRYSEPSEYNVNGNLTDAIDMTIDSDLYVLKTGGTVIKLFRGETRPFTIRNLPTDALKTATRIIKPSERGNFYFLDPENSRIVVVRTDDDSGEALYLKQYILEGEQVGVLQDFYVDPEETQLMVLDEKRLYSINLQEG